MLRSRIIGTGHYVPEKIVTNAHLEEIMDTSDEWIRQRTGILQRHMVEPGVGPADLAIEASKNAMEKAGITADEIDFIICATITPDYPFPASSCIIQAGIEASNAGAMDIGAACSGFVYGLSTADAMIRAGMYNTILVIGAEVMSARLDFTKRDTAVLFGDGAGAAILRAEEGDNGVLSTYMKADGTGLDLLYIPAGGSRKVLTTDNLGEVMTTITMDGQGLYKRAVMAFGEASQKALERSGISVDDIDLFVPHQANQRIIYSATRRLGLPDEKVYLNLQRVANTSAASIPIALDDAVEHGRINEGSLVLLAAFGAGLTWAGAMIRW